MKTVTSNQLAVISRLFTDSPLLATDYYFLGSISMKAAVLYEYDPE